MSHNIISVNGLTKVYEMGEIQVHALRGIELDIETGDFVAIMGSSGSGKSTFMNILGCLDIATHGKYYLDDVDISELSRDELAHLRNLKIGFVFQSFNLLPRTSALENVELPLMYNKEISTRERHRRSVDALNAVGLGDRIDHLPNQLSGGQQQRVAIARSLVNEPKVIMADEPTGNLDTHTSVEVMDIFQTLNNSGITVVLVTHEPDIAQYAKTNVVFRDGRIHKRYSVEERKSAKIEIKKLPVLVEDDE